MQNILILLIIMISPFLLFAHNPLSARYHLEAGENASLLTINLSQDGVNQVLLKKYSKERLEEMSPKEWKELIVDYVKTNFNLSVDRKKIELQKGGIKLGSHQTDLRFVLPPISKKVERMAIDIPAFKENDHHQTIFSYDFYGKTDKAILRSDNNYQATIPLQESRASIPIWVTAFMVGLGVIFLFFYLREHANNNLPT